MPLLLFFHKIGWILVAYGVINLLVLAVIRLRVRRRPAAGFRIAYALTAGMLLSMVGVGAMALHLASRTYIPLQ